MLSVIGTFKAFTHIYVLREQAVGKEIDTMSVHIFNTLYSSNDPGYASALAFILFGVILILTLVQNRLTKEQVFLWLVPRPPPTSQLLKSLPRALPLRRRQIHINPFRAVGIYDSHLGRDCVRDALFMDAQHVAAHSGDIIRGRFLPTQQFISFNKVSESDLNRRFRIIWMQMNFRPTG